MGYMGYILRGVGRAVLPSRVKSGHQEVIPGHYDAPALAPFRTSSLIRHPRTRFGIPSTDVLDICIGTNHEDHDELVQRPGAERCGY
jgi:hypothetical protein